MILTGKNIFKSYKKDGKSSLEILKDVWLEIEKNKITIIVGASGAGKSTLLHVLSGLDTADSGEIILSGKDIVNISDEKLSDFRNKHIGFIFQFHHLLPEFTAAENVAITKMISGVSKKDALRDANELLASVGLEDRINHKPAELSGGEQQRVAVARAIINNPDIIFADEPTGNLDSVNSEILNDLFIKLKEEKGATFLIVTHNPGLVKIADRVLEMKDGKVLDK